MIGFSLSIINFIEMGITPYLIIVRALDLITVVVPPALPATLSIGTSFALQRLKDRKIFCISPPRINVGGKLNCLCFDKTGTLTEDGLDILGIRIVDRNTNAFSELHQSVDLLPDGDELTNPGEYVDSNNIPIMHALAACHSLKLVHGELIGDPLDLKMFDFTQWELEENHMIKKKANEVDVESLNSSAPTIVRPRGNMGYSTSQVSSY